jgi:hypothetical protein
VEIQKIVGGSYCVSCWFGFEDGLVKKAFSPSQRSQGAGFAGGG